MGDSSERCSGNDSFPYMDDTCSDEDEKTIKKANFVSNRTNGDFSYSCRDDDVRIQIDLDAPVPICPDSETTCSDNNGHEEDAAPVEPKISPSEALGKEANGFDEAAVVEGSEEEVRTGSPTGSSEAWGESNYSDEEFNHSFQASKPTNYIIDREPEIPYRPLRNVEDDYNDKTFLPSNGTPSVHQSLYSKAPIEMQEFVGKGESYVTYNHSVMTELGRRHLETIDTYQTSGSGNSYNTPSKNEIGKTVAFHSLKESGPSCPRQSSSRPFYGASYGSNSSLFTNASNPLPSSQAPWISGTKPRTILPYESKPTSPPLGYPLDVKKVSQSVDKLISGRRSASEVPKGMPAGEPISFNADNDIDASGNDVETKKKKKKKKRSGNKGTDVAEDKKPGRNGPPNLTPTLDTEAVHHAQYPAFESSSSVMEQSSRNKAKQSSKNKKKNENEMMAKDIDGNRGGDDIDTLLHYVEGKKKTNPASKGKSPAATSNDQKKKQKKQKVMTRPVTISAVLEPGRNAVMGSVVEETFLAVPENPKPANDTSVNTVSVNETVPNDDLSSDVFPSTKVDGSGDQLVKSSKTECANEHSIETALVINQEETTYPPSDEIVTDITSCVNEASGKPEEAPEVEIKEQRQCPSEASPPSVCDLEFTNFEGLIDCNSEQPFEKYVGRKKKQRSQQVSQQYRQSHPPNSSFGPSRGRWSSHQTNQPHMNNSNNRVHGNGFSHSAPSHSQTGPCKPPAGQTANRYPPASTSSLSFAAKASSSTRVPQTIANDQRKSIGPTQCPRSPPSAVPSGVNSPPPREEFPPLRPTSDTLKMKKENSTSVITSHSCKKNSSDEGNNDSLAAGDREPSQTKIIESRGVLATQSGDGISIDTINIMKIKQFIEMLYPQQNETCSFYSENAKRHHFLRFSAKNH